MGAEGSHVFYFKILKNKNMKKILFILFSFAILFSLNTFAQTTQMTGVYVTGDTVINTATKACSLKITHSYRQVTIHGLVTKVSGTVAGTLTLQGTVDGNTWLTVDTASLQTEGPSTFTTTNVASQSKVWIVNQSPYLWFRLSYTGSGTMAAILKGYVLPRLVQD